MTPLVLSALEKSRILMETTDAMARHVAPATAALHGVISMTEGELVGTGAFVELHGAKYLLTAAHVAESGLRDPYLGLAHSTDYGGRPAAIENPVQCLSFPSDLALVRLDEEQTRVREAIDASAFEGPLSRTGQDVLFLMGFPGAKSRFTALSGGIVSEAVPFGTVEGRSSYEWFDPRRHIALDYPAGDVVADARGRPTALPDPPWGVGDNRMADESYELAGRLETRARQNLGCHNDMGPEGAESYRDATRHRGLFLTR